MTHEAHLANDGDAAAGCGTPDEGKAKTSLGTGMTQLVAVLSVEAKPRT
jgi:hypothetical protein